jgi:hypothetical protein
LKTLTILLVALLTCFLNAHAGSQQKVASFMVVSNAMDWSELYKAYKRFGKNADGVVAGAFSEKVSELLADRWDLINQLRILGTKDKQFLSFVMYYLGVMGVTTEQDLRIRENATNKCFPKDNKQLCQNIIRSLDQAWERARGKEQRK